MALPKFTNRLSREKSPYLLQHAHNPVDWYPWGEEAFAKARVEDKPVFLSIGYSTCHWCHVMEHESFESEEIAKVLNEKFVPIKVDREERPDIDNIYMTVVTALTGSGGWPLSVFLTPDKMPFYGGTYFPPVSRYNMPGFSELLLGISQSWQTQRSQIITSGAGLTATLREHALSDRGKNIQLDQKTLEDGFNDLANNYDARFGGFGQEPKFPMGHSLSFLLRYWKRSKNENALEMVRHTLAQMARGGMYDQLGGGFHRYSTDREWQVPHFEKMLYDQAILARVYTEGWQAAHDPLLERIVRETLDYVLRDMTDAKGGFYSAEDADSLDPDGGTEKKEGAFYVWRCEELKKNLTADEFSAVKVYFGIEENGNAKFDPHEEFAGKNILAAAGPLDEKLEPLFRSAKQKLFALRSQRPRPYLDDKVLVDWNGLMISSLAFAGRVLKEPRYIAAAAKAADFILKYLVSENGRLLHRYRDNEAAIPGTIEDHAFFIRGLTDLYEATFKDDYLKRAGELQKDMLQLFWDGKHGGFFFTAVDSEELLFRQKEIYDGAIPSGNSAAALDLIRLERAEINREGEAKAREIFQAFAAEIIKRPGAYTQLLIALDFSVGPSSEIVISGKSPAECREFIETVYETFLPNTVVLFRAENAMPAVSVCQNRVCLRPVHSVEELRALLK